MMYRARKVTVLREFEKTYKFTCHLQKKVF